MNRDRYAVITINRKTGEPRRHSIVSDADQAHATAKYLGGTTNFAIVKGLQ